MSRWCAKVLNGGYAYENDDRLIGELTYYRLQFNGTTEINGKTYHNLLKYQTYTKVYCNDIIAYMREEDKKVYITYSKDSSYEFLVFDFGLKEGDKFPGSEIAEPRECIETGFVETTNGPRRYMKFSSEFGYEYDMLVEGIGPYNSNTSNYHYGGSIFKPTFALTACNPGCDILDILLYERKLNENYEMPGEITWKNPVCFEAFGAHDPTIWKWGNYDFLGAVENTLTEGTDVEITLENNAVNVNSSTTDILFVETYDLEGRLLSTMKPVNNRCSVSLSSIGSMAIVKVTTTSGIYSTKVAPK